METLCCQLLRRLSRARSLHGRCLWVKVRGALSEKNGNTVLMPPSDDFKFENGMFRQRVQVELVSGEKVYLWGRLRGTLPIFDLVDTPPLTESADSGWTVVKHSGSRRQQPCDRDVHAKIVCANKFRVLKRDKCDISCERDACAHDQVSRMLPGRAEKSAHCQY